MSDLPDDKPTLLIDEADIRNHKGELLSDLTNHSPEPAYHGFSLSHLEAEAADDWQEISDDPAQLEAFAHALRTSQTRQRGKTPDHYTQATECAHCGLCGCGNVARTKCRVALGA